MERRTELALTPLDERTVPAAFAFVFDGSVPAEMRPAVEAGERFRAIHVHAFAAER